MNATTSSTAPEVEVMEKPTQLAPRPVAPIAVKTPRAVMLAAALEEEREQRDLLRRYVDEFMVQGEDYGVVPGTERKDRSGKDRARRGLFKPGAEKLMDLFRCRPEYEVMAKEVNHESGLYYYEIRCRAVSRETDTVLNEGVGSASSYESKYRYRNAGRLCPKCQKDTIIKGREEYGGGWICFAKKGGCGAKWPDGAAEIEGQQTGKVQNPDLADVANTVLKMAKKRAQVDCAIALARVSDMFTQDVEDMPGGIDDAPPPDDGPPPEERTPHPAARPAPRQEAPPAEQKPATGAPPPYVMALWNRLVKEEKGNKKIAKTRWDAAAEACDVPVESKDWTKDHARAVAAKLWPEDVP